MAASLTAIDISGLARGLLLAHHPVGVPDLVKMPVARAYAPLYHQGWLSWTVSRPHGSHYVPQPLKVKSMIIQRHEGAVKWFNADKGYGFITEGVSKKDYLVKSSDIAVLSPVQSLKEGQQVSFVADTGKTGLEAREVHILSE